MSCIKVLIKPFDNVGKYKDYEDITNFVDRNSISSIKRSIDSTEYDVGVIKVNSISIKLANETGKFSDVDNLYSMFSFKRSDSLIKIIWAPNDYELQCGVVRTNAIKLAKENGVAAFVGMINDEGTKQKIKDQKIDFKCFGMEYLFKKMTVPYASINVGDLLSDIILKLLDQPPFNNLINVSASNITIPNNVAIDVTSDLQNKMVDQILPDLLLTANAVLYIENETVFVKPRSASAEIKYYFYGQASNNGIENIEDIYNFRNGLHRVFNHWVWSDTNLVAFDTVSTKLYGNKNKEISLNLVTSNASRQVILNVLLDEFKDKKREMEITTSINHDTLKLKMLDKVSIDYPAIPFSGNNDLLPIYGVAKYGDAKYPFSESSFIISKNDAFKIIAINYNLKSEIITLKVREV